MYVVQTRGKAIIGIAGWAIKMSPDIRKLMPTLTCTCTLVLF